MTAVPSLRMVRFVGITWNPLTSQRSPYRVCIGPSCLGELVGPAQHLNISEEQTREIGDAFEPYQQHHTFFILVLLGDDAGAMKERDTGVIRTYFGVPHPASLSNERAVHRGLLHGKLMRRRKLPRREYAY